MRKYALVSSLVALLFVVGACARQNEVELSLVSTNVVLRTEIAQVRESATVDADRLQITLEYVGTLVSQADQQGGQLRATLISRGTEPAALTGIDPGAITPLPTIDASGGQQGIVISTPAQDASINSATGGNVPPLNVTPEAASSAPALTNIVMARGVNNNDCAQSVVTDFTTSDAEIYVVATAMNIVPGTTITARYQIGGNEVVHSFTPDFNINENCIWFYTDQTETVFTPGSWNVQLDINGQPAGQPIPFSISE